MLLYKNYTRLVKHYGITDRKRKVLGISLRKINSLLLIITFPINSSYNLL